MSRAAPLALFWLGLVLAGLSLATGEPAMSESGMRLNFDPPTLGGKQFWRDVYLHAGWRIQHNLLSDHYRLLDTADHRHAWGRFDHCMARFEALRAVREITPASDHLVVLIHGIARSTGTFSRMAPDLRAAGYDAVAISYPSTRATIDTHAQGLNALLDRVEGSARVSFVTHSMGALVLRRALAEHAAWRDRLPIERIVMIAPPSQGSAVARWLKDFPPYRWLYGRSGQQLQPGSLPRMAPPPARFGIIAGGKGDGAGFNPLLAGDDDGTVAVDETRLDGAADFRVVRALHARIPNHPAAIAATLSFLRQGHFGYDPSPPVADET